MNALPGFVHEFRKGQADRTLLLLHGTGGNEGDLLPLGHALAPDANLLSPRGKVLENGMPRFFRRLAEGVFDEEDLRKRTHELADFVALAAREYSFATGKVIAVGYSNGANIAASMLLLRPGAVAHAILFRPMVPLQPEPMPDLSGVRVFIATGTNDPIIPAEQARLLGNLLRTAGVEVTETSVAAGHGLTETDLQEGKRWLQGLPW